MGDKANERESQREKKTKIINNLANLKNKRKITNHHRMKIYESIMLKKGNPGPPPLI